MTTRFAIAIAVVAVLGGTSACRRQIAPGPTPTDTVTTVKTSVSTSSTTSGGTAVIERRRADTAMTSSSAAQRRADSLAALRAESAADARAAQAEMTALLQQRVYFEYDRDDLREEARSTLDAKSGVLLANPDVTLTIVGHTDERGTAEYNLALGQRRAAQVKRYLVSRGIADARLVTESLGDSQPAVAGTDETAYAQNRRAEFEIHNGGALVRPRP